MHEEIVIGFLDPNTYEELPDGRLLFLAPVVPAGRWYRRALTVYDKGDEALTPKREQNGDKKSAEERKRSKYTHCAECGTRIVKEITGRKLYCSHRCAQRAFVRRVGNGYVPNDKRQKRQNGKNDHLGNH